MRNLLVVSVGIGVALAGCGDNSRECGEGTNDDDDDGICEVIGDGQICGDGTVEDPISGDCVVDPSVCGGGTVLINGECKDPAEGLDVDLLEGLEPNGFEPDATPAGIIVLEPVGSGFVIHGCVKPLDNNTPDLDRYTLAVTGPTLIEITADGIEGLAAGFVTLGDPSNPLLQGWQRLGINLATDTSKREVFLPAAGTYELVITDSRTLLPITQGSTSLPAAGDLEGKTCYYVSLAQRTISPQPLDLATGDSGTIGEKLKFYTGAFPDGFTSLVAVIDPEDIDGDGIIDIDSRAASSIVVLNNTALRQVNDANALSPVSSALFGGIQPGDDPLIVLDYVWNMTIQPADYSIAVDATIASQALSTTGGAVSATSRGQFFVGPGGDPVFDNLNLFHWDVATAGEVDGFDLVSSIQLQGVVTDGDAFVVSRLTGLQGNQTSSTTFAAYKGLLRTAAPGRYYLFVFAPRNPVGTAFTVTSTITPQVLEAIALDTPLTQPVNAFNSNALTYDAGTEPWQLFNATGTNTGAIRAELFDAATTFGRLDNLVIRTGGGAGTASTLPNDCAACDVQGSDLQHRFSFAATGATPAGRILKHPLALTAPVTSFLVKVNPTLLAGARSFTLDFETRLYNDFGGPVIDAGTTRTLANETIDLGNPERRYYFETAPNNIVTITATPSGTPTTLNAEIALIDTREADGRVIDVSPVTGAESVRFGQLGGGFTAFKVRGGSAASTGSYSLQVKVEPAFVYTLTTTATAFADACTGGTVVTLSNTDDGLSGAAGIAPPAGFTFFGTTAPRFRVSSNGFLTFNLAIPNARPDNQPLPNPAGEVNIAPFWDDLANVVVCQKTVSGKLVVQWTGDDFLDPVQFQAILDPADDSIEFVWAPTHTADGRFASVGIQGAIGAHQIGFDQAVIVAGSSQKLTPP
jgi:hypothetical protein